MKSAATFLFKIFKEDILFLFSVSRACVFPACSSVHHRLARRGLGSLRTRIMDGYELPCGGWELTLGLLE